MDLRSDARRNRELVLRAAQEVFATEGVQVPLAEVAHRAGVGAGTVHRHFPTKDALVAAVLADWIDQLTTEIRAAADSPTRFLDVFAHLVRQVAVNKSLCAAVEDSAIPTTVGAEFRDALAVLVDRARQAGVVRPDVTVADVLALVSGCVVMEKQHPLSGRMTDLVGELLGVTKPSSRNETRDEIRCAVCGTHLAVPATGRRPKFCGPACRQKAHRQRAAVT
ncbi:hypothetical protein GCM10029964_102260 [Kibdelosporangium lantanae]